MVSIRDPPLDYDVVIVGAGISGIALAYRLQERNPDLTYCILESRHEIGGTWSLFQYPGIRSDSDLHSFGFPWRPWMERECIAHGSLISRYLKDAAADQGIDKKIKFHHRVERMSWSTQVKSWTLDVSVTAGMDVGRKTLRTPFLLLATGYYDYERPLKAAIPGIDTFQGTVVHPQFWPADLDYAGKNVTIIGSGATAITLLPAIAEKASHVTMLQRSPSYVTSLPREDGVDWTLRRVLPCALALKVIRFKWILAQLLVVSFCRAFPNVARSAFRRETRKQVPPGRSLDPDFEPSYAPWQQRMCVCPDGDFYECLRNGSASIKTDEIATVTATSIRLKSGGELHPDVIITATGLQLQLAGGMEVLVDGTPYHIPDHFLWKGAMVEDLPNVIFSLGYADASWTLGADATAQLACRLLSRMKKDRVTMIVPRRDATHEMKELPMLYLMSTYVRRGNASLPKTGDRHQWRRRSYYWKDLVMARWGDIKTDMEWSK